jgi:hypothetical protein
MRARTDEGRERAKARGVHSGPPANLTPHQKRHALKALAEGTASQADLARRFNIHPPRGESRMKSAKLVATFDTYSEQDTADKLVLPYLAATYGFPTPDSLDSPARPSADEAPAP